MKRSVLVAAGTAVGVTAVVSYHASRHITSVSLAASGSPASTTTGSRSATHHSSAGKSTSTTSSTSTSGSTAAGGGSAAKTRTAVGQAVSYPYGDLRVKVTEHHGRITDVSIVSFSVPEAQSQSIDQFAVPRLRTEVLSAQSAHIDGVSGASYTSQAYAQSVQSALDRLA
ncbi:MAG: FMN-binding protein [Solirubrobacteraceae bacterium]